MLKKIAVVGGIVAVAGLGVGGAAWAESNSSAPQAVAASSSSDDSVVPAVDTITTKPVTPSTAGKTPAAKAGKAHERRGKRDGLVKRLEKVSHAQWVSKDEKTGTYVTHDVVRGSVSAVSAGSITIKAADGTSETYVVNSSTKVHVKGVKGKTSTVAQVKVGDQAGVLGTGATTRTATQILDRGVAK